MQLFSVGVMSLLEYHQVITFSERERTHWRGYPCANDLARIKTTEEKNTQWQRYVYGHIGEEFVPGDFLCPITYQIMRQPVTYAKHTFEKNAIERWLMHRSTCPITRVYVEKNYYKPNDEPADRIGRWVIEHTSVSHHAKEHAMPDQIQSAYTFV